MGAHKIIIAGFGGQGVMLLGQVLATAAMIEGKEVTWMPSYGPEMRGGTANCSVIISDEKIASPIFAQATAIVAMNGPSLEKFQPLLLPGKDLFVNSTLINAEEKEIRSDVKLHKVDCIGLAMESGNEKAANMVMLGAIVRVTAAVGFDSVKAAMGKTFAGGKEALIDMNIRAAGMWKSGG